ncbi:MAG: beta-N-acetylhexosaminidase [Geminicoccaceae bacterium]
MSLPRSAAVIGLEGASLTAVEINLIRRYRPAGFILFRRNCGDPVQLRRLADRLREVTDWPAVPILVDQEGGRVQRLTAPAWPCLPPAGKLESWSSSSGLDPGEAARRHARRLAVDLIDCGIGWDCAPVLDVADEATHQVIGDRSFGSDPEAVAIMGSAALEAMIDAGIVPVIKHLPGHGRARLDSHLALPTVDASIDELRARDFVPFRRCAHAPAGMTAHLRYDALDGQPATFSKIVIERVIRSEIGFDGLLFSDDISMGALDGDLPSRCHRALAAGCDLVLHCTGDAREIEAVLDAVPAVTEGAAERLHRALAMVENPAPVARADIEQAMAGFA